MRRMAGMIAFTLLACSARGAPSNGQPEDKGSAPMTTPTPTPTAKPTTTLEQVKQAYPNSGVAKTEHNVPGVELFNVVTEREMPQDKTNMPTVVAIKGGLGSPILTGSDAMKAVIAATKDPMLLAQVAMAIEQQDAELLTAPKNDDQKKQNVGPPKVDGNAVTYWTWTRGVGRMLWPMRLDFATGKSERVVQQVSQNDKVAKAIELLASNNPTMEGAGVRDLAAVCATDAKARNALLDAAAKHSREQTRAAAVDASAPCGTAAIDTLIGILDKDASMTVRWKAAKALGDIGDAKAKPALEKAAQSSDTNVKTAATRALGKLK
jgi:hypothetical protein